MNGATLIGLAGFAAFCGCCWLLLRLTLADLDDTTPWDHTRHHRRRMDALDRCRHKENA